MDALDMDRCADCREFDVEGGAFAGRRAHINLSGMLLDDAVTHGKTEAGAAATGFGGEERAKDAMNMIAWYAAARIRNFNFDAAVMRRVADFQHSTTAHSITRVQSKVQDSRLHLVG